jgi:O-methyltransferase
VNKKALAKSGKRFVENMLFQSRKALIERNLDPARDSVIISWATYSPWLLDQNFQKTYSAIKDYTLVDLYRCYELWHLLAQTVNLPGDILEVGTWRGGTGCLLAKRANDLELDTRIYLCDTFAGVVKTGTQDAGYSGGEHADTSALLVEQLARTMDLKNVEIRQGIFPEETGASLENLQFRFCHIDVDVYQSGKDILAWVWPRMPLGGVVVFDDFGFASCTGITQLVHEVEQQPDRVCVQNLNGHAVFIKVS